MLVGVIVVRMIMVMVVVGIVFAMMMVIMVIGPLLLVVVDSKCPDSVQPQILQETSESSQRNAAILSISLEECLQV